MGCCSSEPVDGPQLKKNDSKSSVFNQQEAAMKYAGQLEKINKLMHRLEKCIIKSETNNNLFCEDLHALQLNFTEKNGDSKKEKFECFECPICFLIYSNTIIPISLSCGHSMCEDCGNKKYLEFDCIECPVDREITFVSPDECPKNSELAETAESVSNYLYCFEHIQAAEGFCATCKVLTCKQCLSLKTHGKHVVKNIDDESLQENYEMWLKDAKAYVKYLEGTAKVLQESEETIEKASEKFQNCMRTYLQRTVSCKEDLTKRIGNSSDSYTIEMKLFLFKLLETLPMQQVGEYKQALIQEEEIVNEVLRNFKNTSLGEKLEFLSKFQISGEIHVKSMDQEPWEAVQSDLSSVKNFQNLIISLALSDEYLG